MTRLRSTSAPPGATPPQTRGSPPAEPPEPVLRNSPLCLSRAAFSEKKMFFRGSLLFRFTFRREFAIIMSTLKRYAPVAQLDRVTDSDSVGRTFESCRAYHKNTHPTGVGIFIARYGSKFMPRRGKSCRAFLYRNVQIICFYCVAQPDRAFRKITQISKLLCIIWLAAFLFLSNAWV